MHWLRDTAYGEDSDTGYTGNGPQVMAALRNISISLLYLAGITVARSRPGNVRRLLFPAASIDGGWRAGSEPFILIFEWPGKLADHGRRADAREIAG